MTVHHCPKCELRFGYKTELDDHCWHDHPEFRHDYPAVVLPPPPAAKTAAKPAVEALPGAAEPSRHTGDGFVRWLVPRHAAQPSGKQREQ
jgi:hypothetical protein